MQRLLMASLMSSVSVDEETKKICTMLLDDGKGVDAFHISSGSTFPHPRNPPGDFPTREALRWYDGMISQGTRTRFNYWIFDHAWAAKLFRALWRWRRGNLIEGINAQYSSVLRQHITGIDDKVKVLCTGGFQHADKIAAALRSNACDAVSIGRPLIANNNLPEILRNSNGPVQDRACTYCNKCLLNDLENPLGCYELTRYPGDTFDQKYGAMMTEVMSVFEPPTFR
jgi:2,4-dienoyl-CoA reductase (NADPH2)